MILVTGVTGFVGKALLRTLLADGREIRCLLRPSSQERHLPVGPLHLVTGTLQDLPALQSATQGVDTIIHLAGARRTDGNYSAEWVNHQGTVNLIEAAQKAGVRRVIFPSHIHADRNSAYPLLRSKGAAEEAIRSSGLVFTILRSSLIFGPDDHFTTVLAMWIKIIPLFFPVPGSGKARFQPVHVDDVATCLTRCLDTHHLDNVTLSIGGAQHLSYSEILDAVMDAMNVRRVRFHLRKPLMRSLVGLSELLVPNPLISREQLDLFSVDNTTDLGNIPHDFDFEPRRFTTNLGYLRRKGWRRSFIRHVFRSS